MDNLNIRLIDGLFVDNEGNFEIEKALNSENIYIPVNLYIENIPKILYYWIVGNKPIYPTKEADLELIRVIYSTNLVDINNTNKFILKYIKESEVTDNYRLKLLLAMQELFNDVCMLNLYDDRVINKKEHKGKVKAKRKQKK